MSKQPPLTTTELATIREDLAHEYDAPQWLLDATLRLLDDNDRLREAAHRNFADYRTQLVHRQLAEEHHAVLADKLADGDASDGHHTHRELYEYRMLYNAHAAAGWHAAGIPVVKSWHHDIGGPCFGGGWFVVVAELDTGQVSNHYAAQHWHLFDIPEVERPPTWDGHTPDDAADRLQHALEPGGAA